MTDKESPTLASLTQHVLNEALYSVLHTLVLDIHTTETAILRSADPKTGLPICPACSLPRLLDPPLSTSRPDKSTQYCAHIPWSRRAGHDIYGNPFPVAGSDKPPTKKEREAQAKAKADAAKDGGGGSQGPPTAGDDDDGGAPNVAGGPVDKKAAKVGERLKGGTYVPWHTCPSCKRSLLITRFAQHLEKCLGIGGRGRAAAAAAAQARAQSQGGEGGSRGATPRRGEDSDDEGEAGIRKKVLKKGLLMKNGKDKKAVSGAGKKDDGNMSVAAAAGKEKRKEREDEDGDEGAGAAAAADPDAVPLRKKQKMQRQHSSASIVTAGSGGDVSFATVDGGGGGRGRATASVNGDESVDGSFVNGDEDEGSEDE